VVVGQVTGTDGIASRGKVEDYLKAIAGLFEMNNVGSLSVTARDPNDASRITGIKEQYDTLSQKS